MTCFDKIDWDFFKEQKMHLAGESCRHDRSVELLDGIINMMDAIQDEFEPGIFDRYLQSL